MKRRPINQPLTENRSLQILLAMDADAQAALAKHIATLLDVAYDIALIATRPRTWAGAVDAAICRRLTVGLL